jgi:DNA-directed RNA polymerase subunit F
MQLAALRQLLRDNEGRMSQEKIDEILDLIGKILRELEKE